MLKIRLQRVGRINSPSYRVIVTEHTRGPKTGNFVEKVGSYNPKTKEKALNADRIKYWISQGAQPSDTMHNMLVSSGIIAGKKINVLPKFVAPEKPAEEATPEAEPIAEAVEVEEAREEEITESAPIATEDSSEEKVANE
ncbi:30S ribosomal protein S16 [Candidatus Kaiserbacteria bacterium]|nr:30S ribosomal protein S16 [Candidatus Kaiserbacteria bacterium]